MKKYLALILSLTLAASAAFVLASCGKDAPETTTAAVTAAPEETVASVVTTEASTAPAESETATEAVTETTTEVTTEAAKAPQTKEEIVAYFNKAVNGVKTDAKSVTRNYSKISLNGSTTIPGWVNAPMKLLGGADKFIDDQLSKQSKGSETFNGSDSIKGVFPVEGESWASKLTASDVKSATCTEKDGKYTITIATIADGRSSSVTHGQGHAPKAFNVVLPGIVNDNVPKPIANMLGGSAEMNYPSCTVTVTVDTATGHVLTADYDLKWTINFGTDISLPFTTHDNFNIAW